MYESNGYTFSYYYRPLASNDNASNRKFLLPTSRNKFYNRSYFKILILKEEQFNFAPLFFSYILLL